ncbi:MAG: glycerophosphodiester phosphodiesterase [Austwickia sp.]|nr:glycerophosphodiester phosphodiesterase [Austwickia sp.]
MVTIVAHRGDSAAYRENTLAAFRSAIACGADRIELDVRTTADGVSVVLHDLTLLRVWGSARASMSSPGPRWLSSGTPTCGFPD